MDLGLQSESFKLTLAVDSSDIIYRIKIEPHGEENLALSERAKDLVLNKTVREAYALGAGDLQSEGDVLADELLYHLKLLLKKFSGSDHTSSETRGFSPSELLCRCEAIDTSSMREAFMEARGNYKEAALKTNAGMICSSCRSDLKALYSSMTFEDVEKRKKRVRELLEESLKEFALMCPPDYSGLVFEISNIKDEKIKVKALGERKGLGRNQIKKTLESFIGKDALRGWK